MRRRHFIKSGALFVPTIFVPNLIRAASFGQTAAFKAAAAKRPAAGGGSWYYVLDVPSSTASVEEGPGHITACKIPSSLPSGTATKLSIYIVSMVADGENFKLGLYDNSFNLKAQGVISNVVSVDSGTWREVAVSTSITSGIHWIGFAAQFGSTVKTAYALSGTTYQQSVTYSSSMSDPFTGSDVGFAFSYCLRVFVQ